MHRIIELIKQDELRLRALDCVRQLNLPQGYIAAGFLRNMVWDHLHQNPPTPLNDVDVIYFDNNETDSKTYKRYESELSQLMPELNWQVRNQAKMHKRNADNAYLDIIDAMSYWPEKETAIAIKKKDDDRFECVSAFGLDSLFQLQITYNPKRSIDTFNNRIKSKQWLHHWPNLKISN